MHQARAAYLIGRELEMTADVALHLGMLVAVILPVVTSGSCSGPR